MNTTFISTSTNSTCKTLTLSASINTCPKIASTQNEAIISCDVSQSSNHLLYGKPHGGVTIRKKLDFYEPSRKQKSFQKRDPSEKSAIFCTQSHHSRLSNVSWFPESSHNRPPSIFLTAGILEPSTQHQEKYQKYGKSAACSNDKRSRWSARRNQGKRYTQG